MGKDVLSVGAALSSPVTQLVGTASPGREMARPYVLPLLWPGPLSGNPRVFGGRAMAIYRRLQKRPLAESGHLFAAYELTLRALTGGSQRSPDCNDRRQDHRDRSHRPR